MKSSVYRNAAITACSLGLLGLLSGCWGLSVSFEPTNPDTASSVSNDALEIESNPPASTNSPEIGTLASVSSPATTLSNSVELSSSKTTPVLAVRQGTAGNAKHQGTLRMSNQTDQPVRLALLARQSAVKGVAVAKTNYDLPAHWDFDPQEGSNKGLILSLPNGNLKLEKGDILVAFAQDGTRRYWGPYVVGETPLPSWNSQKQEWILVLSQ
ncbi:hypothetical protein A6770_25160 [Nostoc minutum NIES-26]|uniref:Uncharacterized protein n=1 Tax=Nostoc minutum NIES-26 TaxID=1844469 RepID=A0A367QUM8_9NOSO|nr:hypothetical protein A6770_25160 [Nostoc minutum NIES-26]